MKVCRKQSVGVKNLQNHSKYGAGDSVIRTDEDYTEPKRICRYLVLTLQKLEKDHETSWFLKAERQSRFEIGRANDQF